MPSIQADIFEFEVQRELARLRQLAGLNPRPPQFRDDMAPPPAAAAPAPTAVAPLSPPYHTRGGGAPVPPAWEPWRSPAPPVSPADPKRAAQHAYAAALQQQMLAVAERKRAEKAALKEADQAWLASVATAPVAPVRGRQQRAAPPPQQQQLPFSIVHAAAPRATATVAPQRAGNMGAEALHAAVAAGGSFTRYRASVLPPDELSRLEERARARLLHAAELDAQVQDRAARKAAEAKELAVMDQHDDLRLARDRRELGRPSGYDHTSSSSSSVSPPHRSSSSSIEGGGGRRSRHSTGSIADEPGDIVASASEWQHVPTIARKSVQQVLLQ